MENIHFRTIFIVLNILGFTQETILQSIYRFIESYETVNL